MLRDGTDRQQLGAAPPMDSNTSSPSWDEAPLMDIYPTSNGKNGVAKINIFEKQENEMSFTEEDSDASSVIVKTVKRRPKLASKK